MIELNKIYNEDCLEGMKRMPDNSVDMIITSPPYNFCLRVRGDKYVRRSSNEVWNGMLVNKYEHELADSLSMEDYETWQAECISEMLRICSGIVFYNIQVIAGNKPAVFRLLGTFADRIKDILIWDKKTAEPALKPGVLNSEFEIILAMSKEDCKSRLFEQATFERGTFSNIIRVGKNRGKNNHRAAFPVLLPQTIIHNFKGDTVFDPFMGSGTTAIAAIKEKRNFVGFELSKEYFDIANKRIANEMAQLSLF